MRAAAEGGLLSSDLPCCVGVVHRTDARGQRFDFYVVGTVHTPGSASAAEVACVIQSLRPDCVVLELDQMGIPGSSTRILDPRFLGQVTWHRMTWRAISARPSHQERLDAVVAVDFAASSAASSASASAASTSASASSDSASASSDATDADADADDDSDAGADALSSSAPSPLRLPSLPYALASPTPGYGADFVSGARSAEALGALMVLVGIIS